MRRLTALGGFDAKGPACFLLEMGGKKLILDPGRGPDGGARPQLDGVGPVDAVLISHGHGDHIGSLDWLDRLGDPPVYATAPTRALAGDRALAEAHDLPARAMIAGVQVETGPAGHAPGAVWMRIGGARGVIYSGDYCDEGGLWVATPLPAAAVAVLDCSYGDDAGTLPEQRASLLAAMGDGPCLLPVPPAGRGIEMALDLQAAGLRVAICNDLRRTARAMIGHTEWLQQGMAGRLADLLANAGLLTPDSPLDGVMLAAGVNCDSGLSKILAPRAMKAGVPVIPTGRLSQGAPAADWVAQGLARRMRWNVHPNRAALARMLDATGAAKVMPAFVDAPRRAALAARFPGIDWAQSGQMTW